MPKVVSISEAFLTQLSENEKLNSALFRGGLSFIRSQFKKTLVDAEAFLDMKQIFHIVRTLYESISFKFIIDCFPKAVEESVTKQCQCERQSTKVKCFPTSK